MTSAPDPAIVLPPLAGGFPAASRRDWEALAAATLKGGALEDLTVRRPGDLAVRPLYLAEDAVSALGAARFNALRSQGPGRWDARTLLDHPDPATANADALTDLENGANSLLLRVDPAGAEGIAAASADDLRRAVAGVELELAPVALDAGWLAPLAGEWLHAVAKSAPRAKLALHMDPVGTFAAAGTSPGPVAAHLDQAAALAVRLAPVYPDATLFLASGRAAYEAGGGEALELGLMAASAVAYVRAMTAAGLGTIEALRGVALGLSADAEYFTTLAKHRAARAIWARICGAFGAAVPARIEARTGRRMLSRMDPWVNLLRLTAAAFGAAVGGADAVVLEPFTQALTSPSARASPFARRQARNAQLVLMEESQLARVEDPAGGCWFLEDQTDQLARAGWSMLQEIERRGGVLAALKDGVVAAAAAQAREARAAELRSGQAPLVGVSVFPNPDPAPLETLAVEPPPSPPAALDAALPGSDDACPPLRPWRPAELFETGDGGAGDGGAGDGEAGP